MASFGNRLKHAWNVFAGQETADRFPSYAQGGSYGLRPDRTTVRSLGDRSILTSVMTRIAIDIASTDIRHVKLDDNERYLSDMKGSGLNYCLRQEANIDQTAVDFKQDMAFSLLDKGHIAIVATEMSADPKVSTAVGVAQLRIGEVIQWFPSHVRVSVYNQWIGKRVDINLPKEQVAVVTNPLYQVMNEPNGTLQRLFRKLALLDSIEEQAGSGKLDMVIQLPYTIKSDLRKQQAEERRKDLEVQMTGSKYGIAYLDATEKITQLNRPVENNMLAHVQSLTEQLYNQLGMTKGVFDGTASETEMLNYQNRTIKPILKALTQGIKRTFLTKTARTQGQSIEFYRDPFENVAVKDIAEIADKLTRNEIVSSNEVRGFLGMTPVADKAADELRNKNLPTEATGSPDQAAPAETDPAPESDPYALDLSNP